MASIQAPSAIQTFLASPEDAIILMEAARQGLIPRTTRRLTRTERADLIDDGAVFIFEEQETQMQRWTDGRRWSCSRVMGEFLAYDEVVPCGGPAGRGGGTQTCRLENGLIKQSFALTFAADSMVPKKYHIISYSRSLTMHQWKRPSQQPQYRTLDLSLWHTYPPLCAAGPSSSSSGGASGSRSAGSRSAGARATAQRSAAAARPKESVSFMFNPSALLAASSSSIPSREGSSTPIASTSSSGGCCPPERGSASRPRPGHRSRSSSPPTAPRSSRYSDPTPGTSKDEDQRSTQRSFGCDIPSSSAAAAVSLLGLGGSIKIEPLLSSSALPMAASSELHMSRPSSPRRRSRSPSNVNPHGPQQALPAQSLAPYAYQPPSMAARHTYSGGGALDMLSVNRSGASSLFLPHPYEARLSSEVSGGPMIAPPPSTRPPWAPSTLDQEDKKMLGRIPFRI